MSRRLPAAAIALAFILAWAPEGVASSGRDQEGRGMRLLTGKHRASIRTAVPVFSSDDRDVISGYFRNRTANLPPGLEKRRGSLPPGLARQLERNGTLPPGLEKRIDPFPQELHRQLPPLSRDYTRGLLGGSAVIVNRRTGAIVDIIHNLLNGPGL
jgi:hypothetical protein